MAIKKIKIGTGTALDINDARNVVVGNGVNNVVTLTNSQYQALSTKDANTIYVITDVTPSGGGGGGGSGSGEENVIEIVKVNGTALTPDANKAVDITVPTISTNISSDATSDTKTASPKSVKTYVDGIVGDIETLLAAI